MIDRINIQNIICDTINEIFVTDEIIESDVEIFISEIANAVTDEFDAYIRKNEKDYYTFIPENNKEAFKDFTTGYVRQMQEWMEANPVQIRRMEIPIEQVLENVPNKDAVRKALIIAGGGSIAVIGLSCFMPSWFTILAEAIVLGYAYTVYKKAGKSTTISKPDWNKYKKELQEGARKDINIWLDKAVAMSEKVHKSFTY